MKLRITLLALASALALHAADTPPVFNATLTVGKEHRFVLVSAAGASSSWLKLGDTFADYKLQAYDAKESALDLERDGKVTRVKLVADATVGNVPLAPTPATLADAEEVFRVMRFDDMMKKVLEGQKKSIAPMAQQQMAQALARMNVNLSDEDKAAFTAMQTKMMDETFAVITSPEMRASMAKIYSEVFTKDELNSMAAFYGTPSGQAMVDKQPDVQQKMMSVMMPMIMKSQQASQQKMAAFMMELRTKYGAGAAPGAPVPAAAPAPAPKP
jgi:hypothetical protein